MSKRTADLLHSLVPWSYGFRSRVAWYVGDRRAHPELMAWYPRERLLDPIASLDMCTPLERAWSARYATTDYAAEGEIVELGAWLGGITLSLVRALPGNPAWAASPRTVHVYDEFLHDRQRERLERSPLEHDYVERGSFVHHFERRLEPYADRITLHVGDVTDAVWTGGGIELLFNDLSKSWPIWNAVRSTFYRSLVPMVSTVVEQDFAHSWTPWLHLWHYRARHHFRFIEHVPGGGSVVFRLERELTPELLAPDAFEDYEEAEVEAAFRWAESLVGGYLRGNVAGAQVVVNMFNDELGRATEVLARALAAATPDAASHSELLSDVVPELARRLEERTASAAAPPDQAGDEPVPAAAPAQVGEPPGGDPPDAPLVPCDLESIQRDLESWSGRPSLLATAVDGTITTIDAAPAWSQWLQPDQWVGGSLGHIDAALAEKLPDGRWVGSVARDDGAAELVILLGSAGAGRRVRMVIVPSEADDEAQTILIASPDLDPPA
ncbi:MAG: hypothetical protein JWO77_115 [Ilumatobacteraceae bacterium]|nr:hypothetical protein [Ilumatobacteraceae bacterium]